METNLDVKLDFINALKKYQSTLTDNDALLVINHSNNDEMLIFTAHGYIFDLLNHLKSKISELSEDQQILLNNLTIKIK